jgi:hypothetical protein
MKFWTDFCFGLAFGCGFLVAYAVLKLVVMLLSHAGLPAERL